MGLNSSLVTYKTSFSVAQIQVVRQSKNLRLSRWRLTATHTLTYKMAYRHKSLLLHCTLKSLLP